MDRDIIMDPAMVTDTAVRPMSPTAIMAAAFGSGSVSGMASPGEFGASGFAADPFILIKSRVAFPERTGFSGSAASNGLKKTLFQATSDHRLLWIHCSTLFSETACFQRILANLTPALTEGATPGEPKT